ncbi:hypothetical protein DP117_17915 [Brasilonema sp. UFV-L1]|nr:hypothetical protein [Brasilonema sp. UFV-L1]
MNLGLETRNLSQREVIANPDGVGQGDTSIRKVAQRFGVAKSFVQKLISMNKTQGHVQPDSKVEQ